MLNRIHLLSSPLNKDSKYRVLYGAQATSCGYDLENKGKKRKTKLCGIRSHCTISEDLIERHVHMIFYFFFYQLLLTKMSTQNKIIGNVACIFDFSHVSAVMQQNQNRLFTRLEQISPVFIIVISVNVAVVLQPAHR